LIRSDDTRRKNLFSHYISFSHLGFYLKKAWPRKLDIDITNFIVTINPVMTNIVSFSRALGDTTRWRIVRLVLDEALCVCELADILEMPQSSVSSHVQVIRRAGLLVSEKCEKWTYFRIDRNFRKLIATLEKFFSGSDESVFQADDAKFVQRLAKRADSCCPGPKILASRNSLKKITS
jgi:ArsR family transcriptional regulator